MSSQPSSTRTGGGPAPIFSSSYGYMDSATQRWSWGRASARMSASASSAGTYEIQIPGRGSVSPAGRCTVSPSRNQPRSHIGRCSIAYDGLPVGVGHLLGEEDRVLVGEHAQVGVETGLVGELHRAQALPVLEVLGDGERQPRPERAVGDVRHQVPPEARHPGSARVLDAGVVGAPLPSFVGGEDHAASMDPDGYAVSQLDLGQADPRDVALLDEAREQVEPAVRGAAARRVEHPHGLVRVAGLRCHHDTEPGHRVGHLGGQHGGLRVIPSLRTRCPMR